jgi:hypothetical protein
MEDAYAALGGLDEFMGGDENHRMMGMAISFCVGFIVVVVLMVVIYIIIKLFGCKPSGFSSFRRRRSKQGTAYKTQPQRMQDPMHSFPLNGENAYLKPSMAREEGFIDYNNNGEYDNFSFHGFSGGQSTNRLDSVAPYEENIRPSTIMPTQPNPYLGNNVSVMLENILYER